MKSIWILKLRVLCLILVVHTSVNIARAESIQFAVDASLEQQDLEVVANVVRTITQAADSTDFIGMLVYDGVFQRSTPIAVADDSQISRMLGTLSQLTASDTSNLAVAIEKGSSELATEGGYLLVFGASEIGVTDPEKLATYTNWLELVLIPDAKEKGIDIVLISPPTANPSASFESSASAFIELSDHTSLINALSTVLPESLALRIGDPELIVNLPEPIALVDQETPDVMVPQSVNDTISEDEAAITLEGADVIQENPLSSTQKLMIGISGALVLAFIAIGFLIFKLSRKSEKHSSKPRSLGVHNTLFQSSDMQQRSSAEDQPTDVKQPLRHTDIHDKMDIPFADPDATVQTLPAQARDFASTIQHRPPVDKSPAKSEEAETSDDLDEIRALTKHRKNSLIQS